MKYSLKLFEKNIENEQILSCHFQPELSLCHGLRIWHERPEEIFEEYIYIISAALFHRAVRENRKLPAQMICVCSQSNIPSIEKRLRKFNNTVSLLFLKDDMTDREWFNRLSTITDRYTRYYEQLADLLLHGRPLPEVMELCEIILGNPVCLYDRSLRLLANSSGLTRENSPNRYWDESRLRQYVSEELVSCLKETHILDSLEDARSPMFIDLQDGSKPYLTCNLFIQEWKVGSISLFSVFQDLCDADIELLDQIASVLSPRAGQEELRYPKEYTRNQQVIVDILKGKQFSQDTLSRTFQDVPYKITNGAVLLALQDPKYGKIPETERYIQGILEQTLEKGLTITLDDTLILICRHHGEPLAFQTALAPVIRKMGLWCGCSMVFYRWQDLHQQYLFARKALEWGPAVLKGKSTWCYQELAWYHRIWLLEKQTDLRLLCIPQIWELYQSDLQTGSEQVESLYIWLSCGRRLAHAADELHIHRTTLVYRLNKIQEMLKLDLNTTSIRQLILISCEIVLYLKHQNDPILP